MKFFIFIIFFANSAFANLQQAIDESYFIEIFLTKKDCEKAIGKCYFRDKTTDETPYFHETKIIIFQSKILAIQQYNDKEKILKIKDLHYNFITKHQNSISFTVKNGEVTDLTLKKGDLEKEKIEESQCEKTQMLYNFYKTYNREDEIVTIIGSFEDEYNFYSMSQYLIFSPKNDHLQIMSMTSKGNAKFEAAKNIKLCKFPKSTKANVKHINHEDCLNKPIKECFLYEECKDYLEVKDCKTILFRGFVDS